MNKNSRNYFLEELLKAESSFESLSSENSLLLFSEYLASNPDFLYNISYLKDSIKECKSFYNEYKKAYQKFVSICSSLHNPAQYSITIIFDRTIKYHLTNEETTNLFDDLISEIQYNKSSKRTIHFLFHPDDKVEIEDIYICYLDKMQLLELFNKFLIKIGSMLEQNKESNEK